MTLAIGVILYNPKLSDLEYCAYLTKFTKVFIYDNSRTSNKKQILKLAHGSWTFFFTGENEGISRPTNKMVKQAAQEGFSHFLMLDQDSRLSTDFFEQLSLAVHKFPQFATYNCTDVFEKKDEYIDASISDSSVELVEFGITSGCVLDVSVFLTLGGYDEQLFIDGVDHEYNFRLLAKGLKSCRLKNVFLFQKLGTGRRNLFGIYEHSALRNYYIRRNRHYIAQKYPQFFVGFYKFVHLTLSDFRQFFSIIFFERNKVSKLNFVLKGSRDFHKGKMGKFDM